MPGWLDKSIIGTAVTTAASSIPWAIGFTKAGVAAGSVAAGVQSGMAGVVAAGSTFATLQSVAATTLAGTPVGAVVGGVGLVAYGAAKATGYL